MLIKIENNFKIIAVVPKFKRTPYLPYIFDISVIAFIMKRYLEME